MIAIILIITNLLTTGNTARVNEYVGEWKKLEHSLYLIQMGGDEIGAPIFSTKEGKEKLKRLRERQIQAVAKKDL